MKTILLTKLLLVILIAPSCSSLSSAQRNGQTVSAVASPAAKQNESSRRELEEQFAQIAAQAKGRVGVAAVMLDGRNQTSDGSSQRSDVSSQTFVASLNRQEHFPMHSVYKLPIAMAVLRRVDDGKLKLDQKVKVEKSDFVPAGMYSPVRDKNPKGAELSLAELLRYAVSESDGTASDVLLNLAGGPKDVTAFLDEIKVSGINVVNSEKEIGRDWNTQYENWATPAGAVELLAALYDRRGLSADSQALLLKLLTESIPGAKRLKGELPAGTVVAHKTGTGGTRQGVTSATNDIGIITFPDGRHLAVAVFVSDSKADEATREGVIARIAKAVWDKWR
jgi:beta-lactamase class A